jgi:hypothetical protein
MVPHVRQLGARPVRVQAAPAATVDQAVIVVPVVRAAHRVAQVVRVVVPRVAATVGHQVAAIAVAKLQDVQ